MRSTAVSSGRAASSRSATGCAAVRSLASRWSASNARPSVRAQSVSDCPSAAPVTQESVCARPIRANAPRPPSTAFLQVKSRMCNGSASAVSSRRLRAPTAVNQAVARTTGSPRTSARATVVNVQSGRSRRSDSRSVASRNAQPTPAYTMRARPSARVGLVEAVGFSTGPLPPVRLRIRSEGGRARATDEGPRLGTSMDQVGEWHRGVQGR